jgi:hypothetical protein
VSIRNLIKDVLRSAGKEGPSLMNQTVWEYKNTYHLIGDDPVVAMAGVVKQTLSEGLRLYEHIKDLLLIRGRINCDIMTHLRCCRT